MKETTKTSRKMNSPKIKLILEGIFDLRVVDYLLEMYNRKALYDIGVANGKDKIQRYIDKTDKEEYERIIAIEDTDNRDCLYHTESDKDCCKSYKYGKDIEIVYLIKDLEDVLYVLFDKQNRLYKGNDNLKKLLYNDNQETLKKKIKKVSKEKLLEAKKHHTSIDKLCTILNFI